MKVLIVESDKQHLDHLLGLVNWIMLGYEEPERRSHGMGAMETIFRDQPDLVLLGDLPDRDQIDVIGETRVHGIGSEFVIMNETASFELARRAMQFGVEEYLLKPVDEEELTRVLIKYLERKRALEEQNADETYLQMRRLLRNAFMDTFTSLDAPKDFTVESLNRRYRFNLQPGIFQSAVIVVNGLPRKEDGVFLPAVVENVRARFDPVCYEMIPYIQGSGRASFVFNYAEGSPVPERLPELQTIVEEHLQKRGCAAATYSIGLGMPERDVLKMRHTLETAERAVRCGILREQNHIYEYGVLQFDKTTSADILTPTLLSELHSSTEALDARGFERAVRSAFSPVSSRTDPAVVMDICWAAVQAVAEVCRPEDGIADAGEIKRILDRLGTETSLAGTVSTLTAWAQQRFNQRRKERAYTRPVRDAKEFIQRHCTQPLTLEMVAEHVHLNASYFSSIFKKETGQNFSDFLTGCRIAEAKQLLRQNKLSVAQVCSAVGYSGNKHFSRVFTKLVGVKPSAYRTLHG